MPQRKLNNEEIKSVIKSCNGVIESVVLRVCEEIDGMMEIEESVTHKDYTDIRNVVTAALEEKFEELEVEYHPSPQEIRETRDEIRFDRMRDEGEI